jgi:hypothetical protein
VTQHVIGPEEAAQRVSGSPRALAATSANRKILRRPWDQQAAGPDGDSLSSLFRLRYYDEISVEDEPQQDDYWNGNADHQ